ncbi:MAG: hydrolase, partial [Gammaproteobacteria bacterium]
MPIIHSPFQPHPLLRNRHLQTLYPWFFRRPLSLPMTCKRLELPDGDFLDLARLPKPHAPRVLILHGLEGNLNSHYASPLMQALHHNGYDVTFMHFRGCSGEHNRLPRRYHSGDTGDLAEVIRFLKQADPESPITAIGFSLGGNVLLKYLGEQPRNNGLKAAIAVSVPFDLADASATLQTGFAKVYQCHLLKQLVSAAREKFQGRTAPIDLTVLDRINTIHAFDDRVTAPLHGFKDAEEYYRLSSCRQYLKDIRLPTHIIHSRDDPFMTEAAIPQTRELSGSVTLE